MKDLVKTEKEFEGFSATLKDILSDVYNYIIRFQDERDNINFTHDGITIAHNSMYIINTSSKWVDIFMANIDKIKLLAENQPTYLVEVTSHIPMHMGAFYKTDKIVNECYVSISTESFRAYDEAKAMSRLSIIKNGKFYQWCRVSVDGAEIKC